MRIGDWLKGIVPFCTRKAAKKDLDALLPSNSASRTFRRVVRTAANRRQSRRAARIAEALEPRCMLSATVFQHDDVGYLVDQSTAQIARYDISNESWMESIDLSSAAGTLSVAHVDDDGIYAAYGRAVYRYDTNGSGQTHLLNATSDIIGIHSDGNVLFLNHSAGHYARVISIDKTTNTIIDTIDDYLSTIRGSSISTTVNRLFGRNQGLSPADITYVSYNSSGRFTGADDGPYHGDYPGAVTTWVFPDGSKVVDDSGTVYSTDSLTYLNSFGAQGDDLGFLGSDIPIVLSGSTLTAFTSSMLPTGNIALDHTPSNIFVNGTNVVTMTADGNSDTGFRARSVPLADLNPPTPGEPIDPDGLAYTPDRIEVSADGTVLLFSKSHQSVFSWDPAQQIYGTTIQLIGSPNYMTYSADTNTIYLAYQSGLIRQIDLDSDSPAETAFATLPSSPIGLSTAGPYVFAADGSGAWNSHYTFAPDGSLIDAVDWNYYSKEYVWNDANQKMYFLRSGSPKDLLWEEINADGTSYPAEAPGGIGRKDDSPLHSSAGFTHPIRISPDGSTVVLGSGMIHDAATLARKPTALMNPVEDAVWTRGHLFTLREVGSSAQVQRWTQTTYGLQDSIQLGGTATALKVTDPDRLLAVRIDGDGIPVFTVLDPDLNEVPPIGFTVQETGAGTTVTELDGTDTFSVALISAPESDVVFTVTSNDPDEVTLSPATLRFTPSDWDEPQTVTLDGAKDWHRDGDQRTVVTVAIDQANSDNRHDKLPDQTVSVTTIDVPMARNPFSLSHLDGANGFRLDGIDANDRSGDSVSNAGDVNGDGFDDLIIGASWADRGADDSRDGETYVVFGTSDSLDATIDLSSLDGSNGFRIDGVDPQSQFGESVSNAGDVNGDGFDDIIIGAAHGDPGGVIDAGISYVVFGRADGFPAVMDVGDLNGVNGFRMTGLAPADWLGCSVSNAGDVNADGLDDIIVGAWGASSSQHRQTGASYVVFGRADGFAPSLDLSLLDGANGFRIDGIDALDLSGDPVASAGDVNGDGFGDLIIGADNTDNSTLSDAPWSYIVFGSASGFAPTISLSDVDQSTAFRIDAKPVTGVGDVNGDGCDDLLVGGPFAESGGSVSSGAVLVYGRSTGFGSVFDLNTIDPTTGFRIVRQETIGTLFTQISGAGDMNGDGFDDFVVGVPWADGAAENAGETYVVFGSPIEFPPEFDLGALNGTNGFRLDGVNTGDISGSSVSNAGDVNGDGFDDLIIAAVQAAGAATRAGETSIVFGDNFAGGAETQVGTTTDDTITANQGASAIDVLIGDLGNDVLVSDGGADVLRGGEGNDTLAVPDTDFSSTRRLLGGSGTDTLRLDGGGISLDLTAIADNRIVDIERIDITGSGPNSLTLDYQEVVHLSSHSNTLTIYADGSDTIYLDGGWKFEDTEANDGRTFAVYTQNAATLKIDTRALSFDLGDAPQSYGTTLAEDGPRHTTLGPTLGWLRDSEDDAAPSFTASSDDSSGAASDDEDGIKFNGPLIAGQRGSIDVTVHGGRGVLDAWIDFDQDGAFDSSEKLALSRDAVNSGVTTVTFPIPSNAVDGMTYARFRLSSSGTTTPTGLAHDGEIEDYQVLLGGMLIVTPDDHPTDTPGDDTVPDTMQLSQTESHLDIVINGVHTMKLATSLVTGIQVSGTDDGDNIDGSDLTIEVTINGGAGRDTLVGGEGDDSINGGGDDDLLDGGGGNDLLNGSAGDDQLHGGEGEDLIFGGTGDDTLFGGEGDDNLRGQSGYDVAAESGDVDFEASNTQLVGLGTDSLDQIEAIQLDGGPSGNRITATGFTGRTTLAGGGGNDTLTGGEGRDSLLGGPGDDFAFGGANQDTLEGGAGNDHLNGQGSSLDHISGGPGNDTLLGGEGTDRLIETVDTTRITVNNTQLIVELPSGTETDEHDFVNEQVHLVGDAGDNIFDVTAFHGDASCFGRGGNDTMLGGPGNDRLDGGDGNDRIESGLGNDSLNGGNGDDILIGHGGDDRLFGQADDDTLSGGDGRDTLNGGHGQDVMQETTNLPVVTLGSTYFEAEFKETISNFEGAELIGGPGANVLDATDFEGDVTLRGGGGEDVLLGGPGNDLLDGGDGDDSLVGGSAADRMNGGRGNDTVFGGPGNDTLNGAHDNDLLSGDDGDDKLFGANGNDTLSGGLGDDYIDGQSKYDTLVESADVDFEASDTSMTGLGTDTIDEIEALQLTGGAGNNRIAATYFTGETTLAGGAGNDKLLGGKGPDVLLGQDGDDTAFGGARRDSLDGGSGNDYLKGQGSSLDSLTGGPGFDTLLGGQGTDRLVATVSAVRVTITGTHLIIETANGVETDQHDFLGEQAKVIGNDNDDLLDASLFQGNAMLFGRGGNDTLIGGPGNDRLNGDDGNDLIEGHDGHDALSGGAGNDVLRAGSGNDRLFGQNDNDTLTGGLGTDKINGGYGIDTLLEQRDIPKISLHERRLYTEVKETFSLIEAAELIGGPGDNVLYTGRFAGDVTLRGGDGNDRLAAGVGSDSLEGGDGDDTLIGSLGADTLKGGDGNDIMSGGGNDDVLNGGTGNDSMVGDTGADSLSGWDGDDTLIGSQGNDILVGLFGNDSLLGEAGDDSLLGGAGIDTLDGGEGDNLQAGHGNYTGGNTEDVGINEHDVGDTFGVVVGINEAFLAVGTWIDDV